MRNIISYKLFESPDRFKVGENSYLYYNDNGNAKPFCFRPDTDEMWIGEYGDSHKKNCPYVRNGEIPYENIVDDGRLWFSGDKYTNHGLDKEFINKINTISFWNLPNEKRLVEILKRLSDKLNINLFDWNIDIGEGYDYENTIPVSDLRGSKDLIDQVELDKMKRRHIASAMDKEKTKRYECSEI